MPLVVADRVKETTTTTGTGTVTLAGAVTGFQSFAAVGNGNTTYYTIASQTGNEWEVGIGTYTSAGTTLSRDTVLSSSNAGALVNFSAGTKDVFVTLPSEASVTTPSGPVVTSTGSGDLVLGTSPTLATPVITANATQFTLQDPTDTTKKAQFVASSIATGTTRTYTLPNATGVLATLANPGTQTFTGNVSVSGSFTAGGSTVTHSIGAALSTGIINIGGTAQTGTLTVGQSTASQTTNMQAGATASGNTKTINFGTGGLSGSTTNINIGSSVAGATTNILTYGAFGFGGSYGTSGQVLQSNGAGAAPTWVTASGAQTSGGGAVIENKTALTGTTTMTTGSNGFSVGPITVASGASYTVPSGQRWVVL